MSGFVYPRLPLAVAKVRLDEVRSEYARHGLDGVIALVGFDHPRAAPVATGGSRASQDHIRSVREAVDDALEGWLGRGTVPSTEVAAFDRALGRALHERMQIIPADAAHDETWSFLTLITFPDVAVLRFPNMHEDRLLGKPRNALRRTWLRHEVVGDLLQSVNRPLGEDELVGLFERSAVARNRALVRRLAVAVQEYDGPEGRSEWARKLYLRVTFATGPRLLDALSDEELDALIRGDEASAAPPEPVPAAIDRTVQLSPVAFLHAPLRSPYPSPPADEKRTQADLRALFEQALIGNYLRVRRELGYEMPGLIGKVTEKGGVDAAADLILEEQWPKGFLYLRNHNRLDLTIEALTIVGEFRQLFDRQVQGVAEMRLRASGWLQ